MSFSCYSSVFLVYMASAYPIHLSRPTIKDMNNSSIKDNIRRWRKKSGMTQEEMAANINISLTAYRDLEAGKTNIVNTRILKIAECLNTSVEELVLGYQPEQLQEGELEDLQTEYGTKISSLEKRIVDLEKLVASLEEIVESKNEIIVMLKKNLAEQK